MWLIRLSVAVLALSATAIVFPQSENHADPVEEGILGKIPEFLEENLINPLTVHKSPTFTEGEHLKYKIGWSMFTVGRSELIVEPGQYDEKSALSITLTTRTNSFADAFYKVRNKTTSWVADDLTGAYEYSARQSESKKERDIVATFDQENLVGRYRNNVNGNERDPIEILPGTFDPLSIVFFVRSIDFDVGDTLVVPSSNGKEFFYTIVHVVRKVERKFAIGKREAYVLEPDIKDVGGVFKKSPDGRIRFFISADEKKLPLRMESEVVVGKFWAELETIEE